MENTQKGGARDFFLYLFATGALYFSAGSVITLMWQYVNRWFPDAMFYYEGLTTGMRFAVSLLIVVFPAYVLVMRYLNQEIDRNPAKREVAIRKVMIYLTLFLAAIAIIVDLVMLVNSFLGGELTVRFGLKALSVLLVAGLVLWYYLFNLKRAPGTKEGMRKAFMWGSLVFVLVLVVGAFFVVGSPATNRKRAFDNQRIGELTNIQGQVINYWQAKQKLPATLEDLNDPISGFSVPVDPSTGAAYEYRVTGTMAFELCATFDLKNTNEASSAAKPIPYYGEFESPEYWQHDAGSVCFPRTIDPQRYPPFVKQ